MASRVTNNMKLRPLFASNPKTSNGTTTYIVSPWSGYLVEAGFAPWSQVSSAVTVQVAINDALSPTASNFTTVITSTIGTFSRPIFMRVRWHRSPLMARLPMYRPAARFSLSRPVPTTATSARRSMRSCGGPGCLTSPTIFGALAQLNRLRWHLRPGPRCHAGIRNRNLCYPACLPGSVSSTGGCRVALLDNASTAAVSSTSGALIPANWVETLKVTPGQKISAISNDAGTFNLNITELTK